MTNEIIEITNNTGKDSLIEKTVHEFGYASLYDFIRQKLIEDINNKIFEYKKQIEEFGEKYNADFDTFKKKVTKAGEEVFKEWDDFNEWEWNLQAIDSLQKKLVGLQNEIHSPEK